MRRRIWRMSEDQFDEQKPQLILDTEVLKINGEEDGIVQGQFEFQSKDDLSVRGVVYSSNPYVICKNPQFQGTDICIGYQVLGQHYKEGDELQGTFTIVCNQVEHRLPFVVHFYKKYPQSSIGEITSLEDFANLAKQHWKEAMQLFFSTEFECLIKRQSKEIQLLYRGYRMAIPSAVNLEEFLVSAGVKKRSSFQVDIGRKEFFGVDENRKETITITKNTWGYIEIQVKSDNPFVTIEKEKITSDYFLGSTMDLNYYIHKERMHDGFNLAKITLDGKDIHKEITIIASVHQKGEIRVFKNRQKKQWQLKLTQLYEQYRLNRITTGQWCEESVALLDLLMEKTQRNWYMLMKAQAYIANHQRQEALWIIQKAKKIIVDKRSVDWAYLLYLCTLIEKEESYVNRLTKEIENIFRETDDVRVFWFLLFLREDYCKSTNEKQRALQQWIKKGYDSPYLYIEAYYLYLQDPYLLQEFNWYSMKILLWAKRHKALTKEIIMQMLVASRKENTYKEEIYLLLVAGYEVCPHKEVLEAIIQYLLKGPIYGERYEIWYERGLQHELKLNGLYEAYVMSVSNERIAPFPQMVTMYFRYGSNISNERKALLYSNIIVNKKVQPYVYRQYFKQIEEFAIAQMKQEKMDDNLAVIYQDILESGLLDQSYASFVAPFINTKKIICIYPNIQRVLLYHEQYQNPVIVPVKNRCAYLPMLKGIAQIFLEDNRGYLISDEKAYYMEDLMYPGSFFERIYDKKTMCLPYVLWEFSAKIKAEDFSVEDIEHIRYILFSSEVSESFKEERYAGIIQFLQTHQQEELFWDYFVKNKKQECWDDLTRSYMIEALIMSDEMTEGFQRLQEKEVKHIDQGLLLRLCDSMIQQSEYEGNDFLISLCARLFIEQFHSQDTLKYLVSHYVGPTEEMFAIWSEAKKQQLVTEELEERLLMQMLYSEVFPDDYEEVFLHYLHGTPNRMLIEAYLSYFSYCYLCHQQPLSEQIENRLLWYYQREEGLNESCKNALLKALCKKETLNSEEFQALDKLVQQNILKNIYFSFLEELPEDLMIKYHLYDKYFVEYQTSPGKRLKILASLKDGSQIEEDMIEMYHGIYVQQFVLFFGDALQYEVFDLVTEELVHQGSLVITDEKKSLQGGRYQAINRMQSAILYDDKESLYHELIYYQGLDEVTKVLFTTL